MLVDLLFVVTMSGAFLRWSIMHARVGLFRLQPDFRIQISQKAINKMVLRYILSVNSRLSGFNLNRVLPMCKIVMVVMAVVTSGYVMMSGYLYKCPVSESSLQFILIQYLGT